MSLSRFSVFYLSAAGTLMTVFISLVEKQIHTAFWIFVPFFLLGCYDLLQKRNNILRNYPIIGHLRAMLISIRPQIQQYFIETDQSGMPFNEEDRFLVYQRSERELDTLPFGTQRDVYAIGYEFANHSLAPKKILPGQERLLIGGANCRQPYLASRLNISAMSYGALGSHAILALNRGAKNGGFAHNTGEGGLTPFHLAEGGDIIWQIGTGYFGCRTHDGLFDEKLFAEKSNHPAVKMVEIKLSQGAKPAHGGILPGVKVTAEIAAIRGLPIGLDAISPPAHSTFSTPIGLLEFVAQLRDLCGGKPVGFKLCLGNKTEFLAICKAMVKSKIYPDFITIDGAEGGTGAAPMEFVDFMGTPLDEALVFIHNSLVGINVRDHIRLIVSGKVISGFDMLSKFALGADFCNTARGMMFALGCVQSRRCNTNECPTGVATQDKRRMQALDIDSKAIRVANFHDETMSSFLELAGAVGVERLSDIKPQHINRRVNASRIETYDHIYQFLNPGALLQEMGDEQNKSTKNLDSSATMLPSSEEIKLPAEFAQAWAIAHAERFS